MVKRSVLRMATVVFAFTSAACVAVFGMDPLSEKAPGADGGPGGPDAPLGEPVCGVDDIGAPGTPDASLETGDAGGSVLFAVKSLDLGIDPNGDRPGFDLDHVVTTDPATSSCIVSDAGSSSNSQREYLTDRPSGIDNAGFLLMDTLGKSVWTFSPTSINDRLVDGRFGFVLQIDDWNGKSDDDSVTVFLFPAIGYWRPLDDGGLAAAGEDGGPPRTRSDLLMPDKRFQYGGSSSFDGKAWVRDGKLVARFGELKLPIRSSNEELLAFDISLHDGWITATLTAAGADGATLEDGIITGRVIGAELLGQIRLLFDDAISNDYVCRGSSVGLLAADVVCRARDIRASHCDDRKSLPCDAISFGARFGAYQVDAMGPFRARDANEYRAHGNLPPDERCVDAGSFLTECP